MLSITIQHKFHAKYTRSVVPAKPMSHCFEFAQYPKAYITSNLVGHPQHGAGSEDGSKKLQNHQEAEDNIAKLILIRDEEVIDLDGHVPHGHVPELTKRHIDDFLKVTARGAHGASDSDEIKNEDTLFTVRLREIGSKNIDETENTDDDTDANEKRTDTKTKRHNTALRRNH